MVSQNVVPGVQSCLIWLGILVVCRRSLYYAGMTPGERIKAERKRQALSQEAVAYKSGVSYRTVHAAETAAVRPQTLRKIVEALGLQWDDFAEEVAS